jgi:hypothetical protein
MLNPDPAAGRPSRRLFWLLPQPHINPAAHIVVAEADPSFLDCGSQPYNLAVQFKWLVVALGALPQKALSILEAVNYRASYSAARYQSALASSSGRGEACLSAWDRVKAGDRRSGCWDGRPRSW